MLPLDLLSEIIPQRVNTLLFDLPENISVAIKRLLFSILAASLMGYLSALLMSILGVSISDPFHYRCLLWRKRFVFITLKNNKIYLAKLLDHTKDIRFKSTIMIMPTYSGYRDEQGNPQWTFKYPIDELLKEGERIGHPSQYLFENPMENSLLPQIIISQEEIVALSLWNDSKAFIDAPPQVDTQN